MRKLFLVLSFGLCCATAHAQTSTKTTSTTSSATNEQPRVVSSTPNSVGVAQPLQNLHLFTKNANGTVTRRVVSKEEFITDKKVVITDLKKQPSASIKND